GNPADGMPILTTADSPNRAFNSLQEELMSDERDVSNDSMAVLASATGGKFFHNSNDLGGGLVQIAALPEVSYALALSPDELKENGGDHNWRGKIFRRDEG